MLPITQDLVPKGQKSRPARTMSPKYITVHNTANSGKGANALAHSSLIKRSGVGSTGWHFVVDDTWIIQNIPTNEIAFHAGDGSNGPGNTQSIGIEICENSDGNYAKAEQNAIELIRYLMQEFDIPIENVKKHQDWSGKYCPHIIIPYWSDFINRIKNFAEVKGASVNMLLQITSNIGLNMRANPSTSGSIIIVIPTGEKVKGIEYSSGWYKVEYQGKVGWVSAQYVKDVTPKQVPTPPTIETKIEERPLGVFRIRKSWDDICSQIGAFAELEKAKAVANENEGYKVFDEKGVVVHAPIPKVFDIKPAPDSPKVEEQTSEVPKVDEGMFTSKGLDFMRMFAEVIKVLLGFLKK